MNVRDLMDRLAELDPEAEVLLVTQPSWPLQTRLRGVAEAGDVLAESPCPDHDDYACPVCPVPAVVYLVEGNHPDSSPYGPRAAWEVAR